VVAVLEVCCCYGWGGGLLGVTWCCLCGGTEPEAAVTGVTGVHFEFGGGSKCCIIGLENNFVSSCVSRIW